MKFKQTLVLCSLCLFALLSFSQEGEKKPYNRKEEIVIKNKRFRVYNNWVELGGGCGYNTINPKIQFVGGLDFNIHIKEHYFQAGVFLSGNRFGDYNNYQLFHLCYGKRTENKKINFSYFGGLSYSMGYRYNNGGYETKLYSAPGLYLSTSLIKKLNYDVGAGPSLFVDVNTVQTTAGIKLNVFFSGAYRGER